MAPLIAELGFTEATELREIHARAIGTFGLAPCPSETAFILCRQCTDQREDELLLMAMESLKLSGNGCFFFCLENMSGTRFVNVKQGQGSRLFNIGERMVFVLPEPPA